MPKGDLLIIGGNEDKKSHKEVLAKFTGIAGGKDGKIGILTTATGFPEELGTEYSELFKGLGARETVMFHIGTREQAEEKENAARLGECSALFITGGNQVRLTSVLGGTAFYSALQAAWSRNGMVVGGTSAGAAVMSRHMIMSSLETDEYEQIVEMGAGFGFLEDVIIDQHFSQRARFSRLMIAIASNPQIMGVGIDENTAIWVREEGRLFEVCGEHAITVFDGKHLTYVDPSMTGESRDVTISGVRLHSLVSGCAFDLINRELIIH